MGASEAVDTEKPLFSFGIIADVQYGDKETQECEGFSTRYREATGKLEKAVKAFNAHKQDILCVLTLGDIIDGNVTRKDRRRFSRSPRPACRGHFRITLQVPTFHLLGNHCLRLPRQTVMKDLGMTYGRYYKTEIYPGWELVVMDSMDLSLQWPAEADQYKEALAFLEDHPFVTDQSTQMLTYNAGIGAAQRAWLTNVLRDAEREGTKLIVASHMPVLRGSAPITHLMWNFEEVSSILTSSSAVVLYLCGHYHKGGYARHGNQHYVTVQGVVQAPPDTEAHGFVHVYKDQIVIEGYGFVDSRTLPINRT